MNDPSLPHGRFGRERLRYIWKIAQRGPTEFGYAYFRARRRRRNRADDEPELSESDALGITGAFDASDEALARNEQLLAAYAAAERHEIRSIQWFLPFFQHAYFGGVYTILRFADHFAREHGVESRFHVYDAPGVAREIGNKIGAAFPSLADARVTSPGGSDHVAPEDLPPADAAIATLWTSVYAMLRYHHAPARFSFIQDFEPAFYAAGSAYALAEETYRLGIPGIVNTPGLAEVYRGYGNPAVSFVPAVDLHRYHPPAERPADGPVRVFFYARPTSQRNAFGLGLAALAQVKERYGDRVDIVCAGEVWNPGAYGVADRIRNLGRLGSLDEVADLYRSCDVGLVLMLTKHPSYQPFEFMACGTATVSNRNPHTTWLLRDGENCLLAPALPTQIAERIGRLVEDRGLRERISATASAEIEGFRWEGQIERVWRAMTKQDPDGLTRAVPSDAPAVSG
ncbi:MAG: glycosyltransferase family 4 protein [Conexibacter sp.]